MPSISWLFFIQAFRSIIISAGIVTSLLPIIGTALVSFFIAILVRRRLNSPFLTILGGGLLIFGRGFLFIPDETTVLYFAAMMISFASMPLFIAGLFGVTMHTELSLPSGTFRVPSDTLRLSLGGGLPLATALSLLLRTPGIELMENPAVGLVLMLLDIVFLYRWSTLFPRGNFARNVSREGFGKGSRLPHATRRSFAIFFLAPIFFYLLFLFERPEWIAAVSTVSYGWTSYAVALGLLAGSFSTLWVSSKKILQYLTLVLNVFGFIGLGLMFYLPPGPYLLVFAIGGIAGVGTLLSQFLAWWQQNAIGLRPNLSLFLVFVSFTLGVVVPFALQFETNMPFLPLTCSVILLFGYTYNILTLKQGKGGFQ